MRHVERESGAQVRSARQDAERDIAAWQAQRMRINDAIQAGIGELSDLATRDADLAAKLTKAQAVLATMPEPTSMLAIEQAVATVVSARAMIERATDDQLAIVTGRIGVRVEVDCAARSVTLQYLDTYAAVFSA